MRVAVLGATGKTGRHVVARLCERGHAVTAVGRSAERLERLDGRARRRVADLEAPETLHPALEGAECVVSLAHARFIAALLDALPGSCRRVVLTGSTRRFTRLPDPAAEAVRAGEDAFAASGVPGVLLHPTMIYGAEGERNVSRILRVLRRWPRRLPVVVPLPDGGRHTVQPVHFEDMVAAVVAAVEADTDGQETVIVPGPKPMSYAAMLRACGAAVGRRVHVLPVPAGALIALAAAGRALRLPLPFGPDELRRACEDKAFDAAPLARLLAVTPRPFDAGVQSLVAPNADLGTIPSPRKGGGIGRGVRRMAARRKGQARLRGPSR